MSKPWIPILDDGQSAQAAEAIGAIAQALRGIPTETLEAEVDARGPAARGRAVSLFRGRAGLAVLFAYLEREQPGKGFDEYAARELSAAAAAISNSPLNSSLYEGITGIAWTLAHLKEQLLDCSDADPCAALDSFLASCLADEVWAGEYDLMGGLVGVGVYALERLPEPAAAHILEKIVSHLERLARTEAGGITWFSRPEWIPLLAADFPDGHYNLGVSHGVAGVIAFLAAVCRAGIAEERARPLLQEAISWLLGQGSESGRFPLFPNWVMGGKREGTRSLRWCYGDLGMAAALLNAARAVNDRALEAGALHVALSAARRMGEEAGIEEDGICHGLAGAAHLFNRMFQLSGAEELKAAARKYFRLLLESRVKGDELGGFTRFGHDDRELFLDAGLYRGAAGIALTLLSATTHTEPAWDRVFLLSTPSGTALPSRD